MSLSAMKRMRHVVKTLVMGAAVARLAAAQTPAVSGPPAGAAVTGVVYDSLAHRPLAGAIVQLADVNPSAPYARSATTDSLGRFNFAGVRDGRYLIGFLHPVLDSIGLEEPTREVFVRDGRAARIDLALPSAQRLRTAICRSSEPKDSTGIILGFIRSAATHQPVEGASVVGEWAEFIFTREGLARNIPRLVATTGSNGWFALCGVPSGGAVALLASHGADSTSVIEVDVSPDGFARRDLHLGAADAAVVVDSTVVRRLATRDSAAGSDSLVAISRLLRTGVGRLTGTVRRSPGDEPLAGAQVSIVDGPRTRADDRGNWTLSNAPLGSRVLEVRAVGYYPERRTVDVVAGAAPIRSTLSTLKSVLDTVRVRATTLYARDRNGFQQRRRSGLGRYITPEDIRRRHPLYLTDLLRTMPGIFLQYDADSFSRQLMMRGSGRGFCTPTIYLDGMQMFSFDAGDLDLLVRPEDITGVEVYSGTTAPPQFQRAFSGCGSIVVWTR
jgi:hypothetical protein